MTPERWELQKCASLNSLVQHIAEQCDSPAELLHLFYLSQEPGLVDAMQVFASLPADLRMIAVKMLATLAKEAEKSDDDAPEAFCQSMTVPATSASQCALTW